MKGGSLLRLEDQKKTREELMEEVKILRSRLKELEHSEEDRELIERALGDYVFDVSDGLRNPLQVVMGYLEGFDTTNLNDEQRKQFKGIMDAGRDAKNNVEMLTEKNNIIARIGHELRTPITIAKGALDLARDEEDTKERDLLIRMAGDAIMRQNFIVDDIIKAAGVEAEEKISAFMRKKRREMIEGEG